MMKEFEELMNVARILNSEGGCPWDRKQTFDSLKPYILEEAYEALEALDEGNDEEIIEELGDLLYTVIFYAKVAEREKRFSLKHILGTLRKKLVRRHPHVFGDAKNDMETIKSNWEKIKKEEKKERKSPLDGIPKNLPLLMRAQKVLRQMKKHGIERGKVIGATREQELALRLLDIASEATIEDIDLESELRKILAPLEKELHSISI